MFGRIRPRMTYPPGIGSTLPVRSNTRFCNCFAGVVVVYPTVYGCFPHHGGIVSARQALGLFARVRWFGHLEIPIGVTAMALAMRFILAGALSCFCLFTVGVCSNRRVTSIVFQLCI